MAMLGQEKVELLEPFLKEMAELVRIKKVYIHPDKPEIQGVEWHQYELDGEKILISII